MAEACRAFTRRATRFAPNAGEIYEKCAELADKAAKTERLRLASQTPVRQEKTPEERARMQGMYQSLMRDLMGTNARSVRADKNASQAQTHSGKEEPKPLAISARLNDYLHSSFGGNR